MKTNESNNAEDFKKTRTHIISRMLDNPDEYGIYPTTKCFKEIDEMLERHLESRVNTISHEEIEQFFYNKSKEFGYDDFMHYCDYGDVEQMPYKIINWTTELIKNKLLKQ